MSPTPPKPDGLLEKLAADMEELGTDMKAVKAVLMGEMKPGGAKGLVQRLDSLEGWGVFVKGLVAACATSIITTLTALAITHPAGK